MKNLKIKPLVLLIYIFSLGLSLGCEQINPPASESVSGTDVTVINGNPNGGSDNDDNDDNDDDDDD